MNSLRLYSRSAVLAPYLVIGVMLGGWFWLQELGRASDIHTLNRRAGIVAAFDAFPEQLGDEGQWLLLDDVDVPTSQTAMLGLTAYISRSYSRIGVSPSVRTIVFIATATNARTMAGHHPPNCYPATGWAMTRIDGPEVQGFASTLGISLPAKIYRFTRGSENERVRWVVNGFLMPNAGAVATLEETSVVSTRLATSWLGLTQYQIILDGDLKMVDVERYAAEIVGAFPLELLKAVTSTADLNDERSMEGES